jgi:hypothetical protein
MVAEGLPAPLACRVLDMSESGFQAWRSRAPSERAIRHAWLTDLIRQIHVDFRGVYGYWRVHAELTLGHGLAVGEEAVWLLMRKAACRACRAGRPTAHPQPAHRRDLVDRNFARSEPDRLWVTDIERHEAFLNPAVVKGQRLPLWRSGPVEAEDSLISGTGGRGNSSPDNDGTGQHGQVVRVRQARRKGVRVGLTRF